MRPARVVPWGVILLILAACTAGVMATPTQEVPSPRGADRLAAVTPTVPEPTPSPAPAEPTPLSSEPRRVEFQADDGQPLAGIYYPAAVNPAAVVVLMHWVRAGQKEWAAIAPWLQNRGLMTTPAPDSPSWLDPSWFPALAQDRSYAVFTFDFRGCGERGCEAWNPTGWLLDAQAAMARAPSLDGVDPNRVAAIGASIGADGAADGCAWLNSRGGHCRGAFSLSPGGYLGISYTEAVATLEQGWVMDSLPPGDLLYCLAAEGDTDSAQACRAAFGQHYRAVMYPGDAHGMWLLQPGLEPDSLQMILTFRKQVLEE